MGCYRLLCVIIDTCLQVEESNGWQRKSRRKKGYGIREVGAGVVAGGTAALVAAGKMVQNNALKETGRIEGIEKSYNTLVQQALDKGKDADFIGKLRERQERMMGDFGEVWNNVNLDNKQKAALAVGTAILAAGTAVAVNKFRNRGSDENLETAHERVEPSHAHNAQQSQGQGHYMGA